MVDDLFGDFAAFDSGSDDGDDILAIKITRNDVDTELKEIVKQVNVKTVYLPKNLSKGDYETMSNMDFDSRLVFLKKLRKARKVTGKNLIPFEEFPKHLSERDVKKKLLDAENAEKGKHGQRKKNKKNKLLAYRAKDKERTLNRGVAPISRTANFDSEHKANYNPKTKNQWKKDKQQRKDAFIARKKKKNEPQEFSFGGRRSARPAKWKKPSGPKRDKNGYTIEQRQSFRARARENKARKKILKKKRQETRKDNQAVEEILAKPESKEEEIDPMEYEHPAFKNGRTVNWVDKIRDGIGYIYEKLSNLVKELLLCPNHIVRVLSVGCVYVQSKSRSVRTVMEGYLYDAIRDLCSKLGVAADVFNLAASSFFDAMDSLYSMAKPEAWSDGLRDLSNVVFTVTNSAVRSFLNLLDFFFQLIGIDSSFFRLIKDNLKVDQAPETFIDLAEYLLKNLIKVVDVAEAIYNGASMSEAFESADPVPSMLRDANTLIMNSSDVYWGMEVPEKYSGRQIGGKLCQLRKRMQVFLKSCSKSHKSYYKIANALQRVNETIERLQKQLIGDTTRVEPFLVVLEGPEGIGKSFTIPAILAIHAAMCGVTFHPDMIYSRVNSSQYWDGYNPLLHRYVFYSEVAVARSQFRQAHGDDILMEINDVFSRMKKALDMSAVEDKGIFFCYVEGGIIDTNRDAAGIGDVLQCPGAFIRRAKFISIEVKPEFQKPGSHMIDPMKVDINNPMEPYIFICKTYTRTEMIAVVEGMYDNWTDFSLHMVEYFRNHSMKAERSRIAGENAVRDTTAFVSAVTQPIPSQITQSQLSGFGTYEPPEVKVGAYSTLEDEKMAVPESVNWHEDNLRFDQELSFYAYSSFELLKAIWNTLGCLHTTLLNNIVISCTSSSIWRVVMLILTFFMTRFYLPDVFASLITYMTYLFMNVDYNACRDRLYTEASMGVEWVERATGLAKLKKTYRGACVVIGSTILLGSLAKVGFMLRDYYKRVSPKTEATTQWRLPTEAKKFINEREVDMGCSAGYARNVNHQQVYTSVRKLPINDATTDLGVVQTRIAHNLRNVSILWRKADGRSIVTTCLGLGVYGNWILLPGHSFASDHKLQELTVSKHRDPDIVETHHVTPEDLVFIGEDIVAFYCNLNFASLKDILLPDLSFLDENGMTAAIGPHNTVAYVSRESVVYAGLQGKVNHRHSLVYKWPRHKNGLCMTPLLIKSSASWYIGGLHIASLERDNMCCAQPIVLKDVDKLFKFAPIPEALSAPVFEGEFSAPIRKSMFMHEPMCRNVEYRGKKPGAVMINRRSELVKSKYFSGVATPLVEDLFGEKITEIYAAPIMQPRGRGDSYINPYNNGLRKFMNRKPYFLTKKERDFAVEALLTMLGKIDCPSLSPLTLEAALNGVEDDPFVRRVNLSTAAGYGFSGRKEKYVTRAYEEEKVIDEIDDRMAQAVVLIIQAYERGERSGTIYKAQLKDEPREVEKVRSGRIRIFFSTPMDALLAQRMVLAPFYSLLVEQGHKCGIAVGISMQFDAGRIRRSFRWPKFMIEGDFSGYDQMMPIDIGRIVNTVVYTFLSEHGYTDKALQHLRGVLTDNLYPEVDVLGDQFVAPGLQPSGKYATAEDNSLRNLTIICVVWYSFDELSDLHIWDHLDPLVYGDDLLISVSPEVAPFFTAIAFAERVRSIFGLGFTTASKGKVEVPFLELEDTSFLKRCLYKSPLFDREVAPLSVNTFHKMIYWEMLNKHLPREAINIASLNSFLLEACLADVKLAKLIHVRNQLAAQLPFRENVSRISDLLKTLRAKESAVELALSLEERMECEFQEYARKIHSSSAPDSSLGETGRVSLSPENTTEKVVPESAEWEIKEVEDFFFPPQDSRAPVVRTLGDYSRELDDIRRDLESMVNPLPGIPFHRLVKTSVYNTDLMLRKSAKAYYELKRKEAELEKMILLMRQYGILETETWANPESSEPFVADDIEGMESYAEEKKMSLAVPVDKPTDVADFLGRPVHITTISGDVNSAPASKVDVWNIFLSQSAVRAKLRNISMIKATLNIRVTVTAMPYHYGYILVSWQPFSEVNHGLGKAESTGLGSMAHVNYLSQTPYRGTMHVGSNKPLELQCPWVFQRPMRRLWNISSTPITGLTDFSDFIDAGTLNVVSVGPIEAATGSSLVPTPISIVVYAYLTDVELGPPTATVLAVAESDSKEYELDEREAGPVERVASNAADVADALTTIPTIAPYAMASSMLLRGVESFAALFGLSRPPVLNDPVRVKSNAVQNGCQTVAHDALLKLSLDPKHELTIDPRVTGSECDELSISYLAARPTIVQRISWTTAVEPLTPFHTRRVNPVIGTNITGYEQPTPLLLLTRFFDSWRGSLTFRYTVVCSHFHRGKLVVMWEPNFAQETIIDADLDLNKQYTREIDIQDTTTFTVTVNWSDRDLWKDIDNTNGILKISPLTKLQSPDGSSVHLIEEVWSNDIMFAQPTGKNLEFFYGNAVAESGPEFALPEGDATEHELEFVINPSEVDHRNIAKLCYGEICTSLRQLMKRYTTIYDRDRTNGSLLPVLAVQLPVYLSPRSGAGKHVGTLVSLYDVLQYSFLGRRGGVRYRIFISSTDGELPRCQASSVTMGARNNTIITNHVESTFSSEYDTRTLYGGSAIIPSVDGCLDVELPSYTRDLYSVTDQFRTINRDADRIVTARATIPIAGATTARLQVDHAVAEDFSFLYFTGVTGYSV